MNAPILDHMSALSDQTRCRMLLLLERHELTVSELCAVLQMPQSSVSRHLKTLADDDWVASRRDGTSRFYSMPADLDVGAAQLWPLIREQVAATSAAGQDDRRLKGVLARRRAKSQEFFANAAAGWDRLRQDLYGDTFYLSAVLGLIDPNLLVGDLGCGTGQLTETVAPYVRQVLAVDASMDMLDAARARLDGATTNVEFRKGELESLPLKDGELDVAVLSLVLHYSPAPTKTLSEAARVIRKGGAVAVSTPNRYSLAPEPHVGLLGVGWLPRKWQTPYVQWRIRDPYESVWLMGAWELQQLFDRNTELTVRIDVPQIPPEEIRFFSRAKARGGVAAL